MKDYLIQNCKVVLSMVNNLTKGAKCSVSMSQITTPFSTKGCDYPLAENEVRAAVKLLVSHAICSSEGERRNTLYSITEKGYDAVNDVTKLTKMLSMPVIIPAKKESKRHIPADSSQKVQDFLDLLTDYDTLKSRNTVLEESNAKLTAKLKEMQKTIDSLYHTLLPYVNKAK